MCASAWADSPSSAATPKSAASFQAPPGFAVEKVAGPPLVRYPLFAAFDDRGRLFVAEGTGTNLPGADLRNKKLGRILLLEDTNDDGVFDTSRVVADQLVFPQGVLSHDGAVYTASHPSFWRFDDTAGAGAATRRTELLTGFSFNGNGCDIHGPFLGPDGRLYWTDGRHGYKVKTRDGENLEGFAARIWRCKVDGTEVERLCGGGFDNPVEIAFTPEGDAIGTMDQGPGDCLLHYVEGGVYPMDHPCVSEFPSTGPMLGAVRQYSVVLPAALCGLTRYRSSAFGDGFRGSLFSTQYMLHKVVQHKLVQNGSTYRAEDSDFVTTMDHDVRLTDVVEDADGSLLLVDMGAWFTYGFLGNPLPKPDALGAIYRVRRTNVPRIADPWGKALDLSERKPDELIRLLLDPRFAVSDRALDRLVRLGNASVPALSTVIAETTSKVAGVRRSAVWALCRIGTPEARIPLRRALTDPDLSVRMAAIHACGLDRDAEALSALSDLATNDVLPARRKAAEAVGRLRRSDGVPALLACLRKGGDRFLEHSVIYALIQIADRPSTLQALHDPDVRVQRAGLIALDQMKGGDLTEMLVAPLVNAANEELRLAALQVIGRRPAWSRLIENALRLSLAEPKPSSAQQRALSDLLVRLSATSAVQNAVAEALTNPQTPASTRVILTRVIRESGVAALPQVWVVALGHGLTAVDLDVRRETVATLRARGIVALDRQLGELSRQSDLPADLRIAALECLAGRLGPLEGDAFALLTNHLPESTDPLLRLAATRAIVASRLGTDQLVRLAGLTRNASALVIRLLLPVFARTSEPAVGSALVGALGQNPSSDVLSVSELDRALQSYPAEIRGHAKALRDRLAVREAGRAAYLAKLRAEIDALQGVADRGHEVFLSQKAGCFSCHRAVGRGGNVGPDLSRIGQIRTRAELLESIVFPGFTIAPEFRTFQVATHDGRMANGIVVRDDPDAITVRTTDLAETRIPRKDIEAMAPSTTSLMPEGLEKVLTRQELADVLTFLTEQR
jgi:putative heme-binding domain-containing protein